jgi:hypothetical protein
VKTPGNQERRPELAHKEETEEEKAARMQREREDADRQERERLQKENRERLGLDPATGNAPVPPEPKAAKEEK